MATTDDDIAITHPWLHWECPFMANWPNYLLGPLGKKKKTRKKNFLYFAPDEPPFCSVHFHQIELLVSFLPQHPFMYS
jgi:hypothetical protein